MHVVSIGNFDGVHEGHRALLERSRALAAEGPGPARLTVVTFDPPPMAVLDPERPLQRLESPERRVNRLLEAGVDEIMELSTTMELLGMSPEDFIDDLVDRCSVSAPVGAFVEGPDFRFGRARSGSIESLRAHGQREGFEVETVPLHTVRLQDGLTVEARSTTVRHLLELGRVEDAGMVLGRPYEPAGTVVMGDRRGRELKYPTANLDLGDQLLPADGVYAGIAVLPDGERFPAAVSVGIKPTFETTPRLMEVHILDWSGELDEYGWELRVPLLRRLRGQYRYDDVDSLLEQMARDCDATRAIASGRALDDLEVV